MTYKYILLCSDWNWTLKVHVLCGRKPEYLNASSFIVLWSLGPGAFFRHLNHLFQWHIGFAEKPPYPCPHLSHINCKGNQSESSSGTINMCGLDRVGRWAVVEKDGWWQAMRSMSAGNGQTVGNIGCGDVETLKWAYCGKLLPFSVI